MSDTVIKPVYFTNKSGVVFVLKYNKYDDKWDIEKKETHIASFKIQSKAVEFCKLLKESE